MSEENTNVNVEKSETTQAHATPQPTDNRGNRPFTRSKSNWRQRSDDAFTEEVITTSRISKTTGGGKRFRFNAVVVVGDGKGTVGFATGKAKETPDAIKKAIRSAKTNTIKIPLSGAKTIVHEVEGKAAATRVQLRPARSGKGVVAGGAVRTIMQLGGIENISTKIHGPKNKLNTIRATFDALNQLETREHVMDRKQDDVNWKRPAPQWGMRRILSQQEINYRRDLDNRRGGRDGNYRTSQFKNDRKK